MKRYITHLLLYLLSLSLFIGNVSANHQSTTETGTIQYILVIITISIIGLYIWWNY